MIKGEAQEGKGWVWRWGKLLVLLSWVELQRRERKGKKKLSQVQYFF